MFGRGRRQADTPPARVYAWSQRIADARAIVAAEAPTSSLLMRIDAVVERLHDAEVDRERVADAAQRLDADRVGRELKDALRAEKRRPGSVGDERLALLRERFATVNRLLDRRDLIGDRIETTVLDVELLAAQTIEVTALGGDADVDLGDAVERLRIDVDALAMAHDELRTL